MTKDSANDVLQLWDTDSQQLIASFKQEGGIAGGGVWSPDGAYLALRVELSTITICDGQTGRTIKTVAIKKTLQPWALGPLAWSPDGKCIAYRRYNTIRIIDWQTENEVTTLDHQSKDHATYAWNAASNRNLLATWSRDDQCVRIWDIESGQVIDSVSGVYSRSSFLAWDPTGTRLARTTSGGFQIFNWDGKTLTEDLIAAGHSNYAMWLSWSPDGSRIATGSQDGNAKIWNSVTGQELLTLGGHLKTSVSAYWHPDGQRLVTTEYSIGQQAPSIYLWDARKGYAAEQQAAEPKAGNAP